MNKLCVAVVITALLALQAPAYAVLITISPAGQLIGSGQTATLDSLTQTPYGLTTPAGPFADGGALFSGTGLIMKNPGQDSMGLYAEPFHDTTNYLAILGGGAETITYSSERHHFGLYWGSIDSYNTITFYNNSNALLTYSGSDIAPLIANGAQADNSSNRYVTFSNLVFDKVVLASSQNSFEVDNISAGVPEASTWMMMLIGFAGVGFVAYRRTSRRPLAA